MRTAAIHLLIFFCFPANAQVIITVAGTGTNGFNGDNIQATAAEIWGPWDVVADGAGNIFIAEAGNNRIRKVDVNGIITTVAGNGTAGYSGDGMPATSAELYHPWGITLDNAGNLYIADYSNNCIRKVNTNGVISTIAGVGTYGYTGDGGQAVLARLDTPSGVTVDVSGNIYIADSGNGCVRKINTSGIITTVAGSLAYGYSGDGGPATAAKLSEPSDVEIDPAGNLYITDRWNNCVRMVNASGIISTIAGTGVSGYSGDGGQATSAKLKEPIRISIDENNNLYIAEYVNYCVRKIDPSGIITTVAGNGISGYSGDGGLATDAEITSPTGVAIGPSGNLYISDLFNSRIRMITSPTGITGIENGNNPISIFPNPSNGLFTVMLEDKINLPSSIIIRDYQGRELKRINNPKSYELNVDMKKFDNGMYIINIMYPAATVSKKIIKE